MDLLEFDAEELYFDLPMQPQVEELVSSAARAYGAPEAEFDLLRAYFLQPEHLTVLVALYRYYYYRHRYEDTLLVADRAISLTAQRLGLGSDWRELSAEALGRAPRESMALTRFLLLALKGSGYLKLRLGDTAGALERLQKVAEADSRNRLGVSELIHLARSKQAEECAAACGDKVVHLRT